MAVPERIFPVDENGKPIIGVSDQGLLIEDPQKLYLRRQVYNSYAGTDILATFILPNEEAPLTLGEVQSISYSIHRENTPVRVLGHVNPLGFVHGPRTIAGTMIFTQFNLYAFYRLQEWRMAVSQRFYPVSDMLPPFDVVISFQNESGSFSKMEIHGVTMVDEGGVMSIDDLIVEQQLTYVARGIKPLVSYVPDVILDQFEHTPGGISFDGR